MDPIDRLLSEHREIRTHILDALRLALGDLAARGDAAMADTREPLAAVTRLMASTLLRHAQKEDYALFPAMERVFGADGSPTGVMREEHREIRAAAELLRTTLHELNEVEHPAIMAGGARLAALTGRTSGAGEWIEVGETIVQLLDAHFAKEEDILFPMARAALDAPALAEIARRMDEIEIAR
jgi:hemerythrin-like domain-containing protein